MPPFESTTEYYKGSDFKQFRVGTCKGLWRATDESYEILAVVNDNKGNGHFKKALWWFEQSCIRDDKTLRIKECFNPFLAFQCWKHGYKWRWMLDWEKQFTTYQS